MRYQVKKAHGQETERPHFGWFASVSGTLLDRDHAQEKLHFCVTSNYRLFLQPGFLPPFAVPIFFSHGPYKKGIRAWSAQHPLHTEKWLKHAAGAALTLV